MRLLGISNYELANQYLPAFILDYNRRFAVMPASSLDFHRPLDVTLDLDFLFSIHDSPRSLQHCKSIMLAHKLPNRDQTSSLLLRQAGGPDYA